MMKKLLFTGLGLAVSGAVVAEDVTDVTRMVCAAGQAQICLETGDCYAATPWELAVPDFVIIGHEEGHDLHDESEWPEPVDRVHENRTQGRIDSSAGRGGQSCVQLCNP
jgi:hypothetical protein